MMESQNLGVNSQTPDSSHMLSDGAKAVESPVDVVPASDGCVTVELGSGRGGSLDEMASRKRGRPYKVQVKLPPAKKNKEQEEEEDVCFICFDGGSLVLCDRRGCPKAYHPACIKRDEAFFESAAKWDCGWHICSICQKSAHHMCYTCTYSLCRACIRKADYVCVRDRGFCTMCMKTIMLIENNGQGEDGKVQADFDDKLSWEYLFKVYWVYLKGKLFLTLDELTLAKNPWKEASTISSPLVVHRVDDARKMTSPIPVGNLEANESKRRKIDDKMKTHSNETVKMEKPRTKKNITVVEPKEWATKGLLDFVAHMRDGDTSVLSQFDVQALVLEYINRNDLIDPRKKNHILCDSRLKSLFGKSRVGHIQMLKLLERQIFVKEDLRKRKPKSTSEEEDDDDDEEEDDDEWNPNSRLTVGRSRKPRNRSRGEERMPHNKLDEFAAVDVHNMNLIYMRRDLMEILLEDGLNFHRKVVGSIVRIKISGSDHDHDMYRLVQVVGTSKVDKPYKIDRKLTDFMLEVLNLDKKETISISAISDQEFSEEECRRLHQSIKCGLVKHFTVDEVREKAVALLSVKLNDVRDHKLQEIPEVHCDPKMNPAYQSDDTEEYFNKENGDHKPSAVGSKNQRSRKKRAGSRHDAGSRSKRNVPPKNTSSTEHKNAEEGFTKDKSTICFEKDASAPNFVKSPNEIESNGSTITKLDHQPTLSSSVNNSAPETITSPLPTSTPTEWHYRDPNRKVQGPFSLALLQRWSTTGCFPADMKIWEKQEDRSLLLNDVLKEQFDNYDVHRSKNIITVDHKAGNQSQTEGVDACSAIPSSTVVATPHAPNPINHEKLSDSHGSSDRSFGQNWNADNNLNSNPQTMSNDSTGQLDTPPETERNEVDLPTDPKDAVLDLPGPTPKTKHEDEKMQSVVDSKLFIQDSGNPPSWSSASSLVGEARIPVSGDGWGVKREEWDSGIPFKLGGDNVATPTSNIDQNIHGTGNDLPTWQGMGEMIEFSTLAEESVSDLLAEVDAMESQYGLPSPTSRRNSFVDDLFNDEFSPIPDQGTRSDGFSSSGDIQLACHSTEDLMKTSNGLQQHSLERNEAVDIRNSENAGFKWPDMEQGMIDINSLARAEGDDGETENVHVKVKVENGNGGGGGGGELKLSVGVLGERPMRTLKSACAKLVTKVAQGTGLDGKKTGDVQCKEEYREFIEPEAAQAQAQAQARGLSLGLDPFEPTYELGIEGEGRNPSTARRERGHHHEVEEDWGRSRMSRSWRAGSKGQGQRICRLNESGRCRKGATCKHLHLHQ